MSLAAVAPVAADWSRPERVTRRDGSRLDSLHQLDAGAGTLHLVHPRLGPSRVDDRVVYQRSTSVGRRWSGERVLFRSGPRHRHVVPNLALAARGDLVAVAWRARGPEGTTLFLRVSRDGGASFGSRRVVAATGPRGGIGVPAVAIGEGVVGVAWTHRRTGDVRIRRSLDGGRTLGRRRDLARTTLSIECGRRVLDGLVGLAATERRFVAAWSSAGPGGCLATRIRARTSVDAGARWRPTREVTERSSFGWPELAARGRTLLATVQLTDGRLLVARSPDGGRTWRERLLAAPDGRRMSAADVLLGRAGRAWLAWVEERIEGGQLVRTRVRARGSRDGGRTWDAAATIASEAPLLRQAANLALPGRQPATVFQSGGLDGSPRHILAARRR